MTHPPRCTRCGRVPPIRHLDGPGLDTITWECRDCGARNELRVARLSSAEGPNGPNGYVVDKEPGAA